MGCIVIVTYVKLGVSNLNVVYILEDYSYHREMDEYVSSEALYKGECFE